ncbi:hypothetical protein DdX_17542 [Ditylenchus destructor]|uniref:Uncharacterized protein n=1 Tax=Ditylenchus destructor TaxID=166010 RepID=A0AAD4MLY3_9BILA|nr:hypothetical protein DdX_17542 [Ditylenchus destructor]
MDRSLLLLFLCVFALSEVLLAARKVRLRDISGMNNSSDVPRERSFSCDNLLDQCDKMCNGSAKSGGAGSDSDGSTMIYCRCKGERKHYTESACTEACKTHLGLDSGKVEMEGRCFCRYPGSCWL